LIKKFCLVGGGWGGKKKNGFKIKVIMKAAEILSKAKGKKGKKQKRFG